METSVSVFDEKSEVIASSPSFVSSTAFGHTPLLRTATSESVTGSGTRGAGVGVGAGAGFGRIASDGGSGTDFGFGAGAGFFGTSATFFTGLVAGRAGGAGRGVAGGGSSSTTIPCIAPGPFGSSFVTGRSFGPAIAAAALANRARLRAARERHGFSVTSREWWHFDAPDARSFAVEDVPLSSLKEKRA